MKEVRGWTLTILAVVAFRTFAYEAVYIPSGSMIPTLEIGDYVIVEKWAYGARLPFTPTAQATWRSPARGDTVEVRDGHLVLNGVPVPRERIPGPCSYWNRWPEGGSWREEPCVDFVESLVQHRYHTFCTPYQPCGDVPPAKVPEGTVWLAGDHRDHSADSRVFGPVPVGRIKGRAWMALVSWGPGGPRWNRLFHFVNR